MRRLKSSLTLPILSLLLCATLLAAVPFNSFAAAEKKPDATAAGQVAGPVPGTKVTEAYARMMAREAYFWAWPMANIYNRRPAFSNLKEPSLLGGIAPAAPLNRLTMLHDYIDPAERLVACPNQDVVYGAGVLALDLSPVVVQVPDFGKRFWVYQIIDLRTDGFADLGAMYGSKPGFYLLVGPDWKGTVPKGITKVFHSSSNTGMVVPRVFQNDTPEDKAAVQPLISQINMYPLAEFDGKMKVRDWSKVPSVESETQGSGQKGETKWVFPEKFFDELPVILADARPLPGEGARYAQMNALVAIAKVDSELKAAMIDEAKKADEEVVTPLLQFRNYGLQLPYNWSTVKNGAAFGTDYFTRTAVARSNIMVNKPVETKYFYQDLDQDGNRLNGGNGYTVTFGKDLVPVKGFWSLTLYDEFHFFVPNDLKRFSIGTKSPNLKYNPDGSLTLYVQAENPGADKEANWLPAPKEADFTLYIRAYWPNPEVLDGSWTPPAVVPVK